MTQAEKLAATDVDAAPRCPHAATLDSYSFAQFETATNPFAYYAAMRSDAPVHFDPGTGFYWVTRYDDYVAFARDAENRLSAASGLVIRKQFQPRAQALWDASGLEIIDTFATSDPPQHENYRKIGMTLFEKRRVEEEVAPRVDAIINVLIDDIAPRGEVEFVAEFAAPLQSNILCQEFGVPRDEATRFKHWTDAVFALMTPGISEDREVELVPVVIEFLRWLDDRIHRAESEGPVGRVFHSLATRRRLDGTPFSSMERVWMALTAFSGGIDTTLNMMINSTRMLCLHPELQDELRSKPERIEAFVEEMLRFDGSVQGVARVALEDIDCAGTRIPKGAKIILSPGAANRDATYWHDAEQFRLDRGDEKKHIAFGYGRHVCIGMHLARAELKAVLRIMLDRLRDIRLAIPAAEVEQMPVPFFRSIARLPIRFTA